MTCRDLQSDLQAYLDGELSPARCASVESHLQTCSECRRTLAELEQVSASLRRWTDRTPDRASELRLRARLAAEAGPAAVKPAPAQSHVARSGSFPLSSPVFAGGFLRWITRGWRPFAVAAVALLAVVVYVSRDHSAGKSRYVAARKTEVFTALASAGTSAQVADGWISAGLVAKRAVSANALDVSRVVSSDVIAGFLALVESDADKNIGMKLINMLAGAEHRNEHRRVGTASVWGIPGFFFGRDVYAAQPPADPLAEARQLELQGRLGDALLTYQKLVAGPASSRAVLAEGALKLRMGDLDGAQTALGLAVVREDGVVKASAQELLAEVSAARAARNDVAGLKPAAVSAADWFRVGTLEIEGYDYRNAANSLMKASSAAGTDQAGLAQDARFRSAWCQKEVGQISTGAYGFKAVLEDPKSPAALAYAAGIEEAVALARIGRYSDSVSVCRDVSRRQAPDPGLEAFVYFQKGFVELRCLKDANAAAESLGVVSSAGQGHLSFAALMLLQSGSKQ